MLMLLGWGMLIPLGVVLAASLRWKDPLWFRLHSLINLSGLVMAVVGFVLAVVWFDVHGVDTALGVHRAIGFVVMGLGVAQASVALCRPHNPELGEPRSLARVVWETLHRGLGYIMLAAALVNVFIGILELRMI